MIDKFINPLVPDELQSGFDQLRSANTARLSYIHTQGEWSPLEWAGAMCGEAGEAANLCKKLLRGENVPVARIAEELADTIMYVDLLAAKLHIDLAVAIVTKYNRVSERYGIIDKFML